MCRFLQWLSQDVDLSCFWGWLCQQFRNKMQHPIAGNVSNAAHEVQSINLWKLPDRKPQDLTAKSQCLQQSMNEHGCRMCNQRTPWVYLSLWHRSGQSRPFESRAPSSAEPGKDHHIFLYVPTSPSTVKRGWSKKQIWGKSVSHKYLVSSFLTQRVTSVSRYENHS